MILFSLILFIFTTLTLGTSTYPPPRSFCTPTSPCWPSPSSWSALNTTLSSRLIRTYPTASICHPPLYSPALCTLARTSWTSSPWRTSQPSAYSALLWELGPSQCFIDDPPTSPPCGQGLVPTYTVNVTEISDITKAVKWAREKRIRIVVKNTGHDHLGRSSDHGGGSLGIWTHNLKGMEFFDSFIPIGAGKEETGVPAIKLAAGEQWIGISLTPSPILPSHYPLTQFFRRLPHRRLSRSHRRRRLRAHRRRRRRVPNRRGSLTLLPFLRPCSG